MGITLGVGPFLGFLLVPFLGRASDRLSDASPLGKRKPFILALCSLLFFSLIAIPHCGHFVHSRLSSDEDAAASAAPSLDISPSPAGWVLPIGLTTFLLCLCVVLFDFSSQVCLSPCEALLSDISSPTHQNDQVGCHVWSAAVFFVQFCLFVLSLFSSPSLVFYSFHF